MSHTTRTTIPLAHVCCPLCGADQPALVFAGPDRLHGVPGLFTMCRCGQCGLYYQTPRPTPDALDLIYPDEYPPHQVDAYVTAQQPLHPHLLEMAQFVAQQHPHARTLLDVGCGSGAFLRAMQQICPGWQVAGTDPGAGAVAAARQHGLTVHHGLLEQLDLPRQQWDVVTLWHVLEHMPDPLGTLHYIREHLLAPGGLLALAVPMADSWDARVFGKDWMGWDLPRHFMVFTTATLHAMLAEGGYRAVATNARWGRQYALLESVRLWIAAQPTTYTQHRLLLAATYSRPLRLLAAPYLQLGATLQRTSVLAVAAVPTSSLV